LANLFGCGAVYGEFVRITLTVHYTTEAILLENAFEFSLSLGHFCQQVVISLDLCAQDFVQDGKGKRLDLIDVLPVALVPNVGKICVDHYIEPRVGLTYKLEVFSFEEHARLEPFEV